MARRGKVPGLLDAGQVYQQLVSARDISLYADNKSKFRQPPKKDDEDRALIRHVQIPNIVRRRAAGSTRTADIIIPPDPFRLNAGTGAFAFYGNDAALTYAPVTAGSTTLTAGTGTFAYVGEGMTPVTEYAYSMQAGAAAIPYTGQSADLKKTVAPGAYTGPGDITGWSTAYGYWGMRGYSAAKIGTGCIDVASNRTGAALNLTTINVGSDGYADLSAIGFSPIYVHKVWDQCGSTPQHLFFSGARPVIQTNAVGGKPSIRFDGGEMLLSVSNCIALPQQYTIAEVIKFYTPIVNGAPFTDGAFHLPIYRASQANKIAINLGTFADTTAVATDDIVHSVIVKTNNASTTCSVNGLRTGVSGNVGTGGFANTNKLTMGAGNDGGAATFSGELYEVILKAGAVTDPNQDLLTANQRAIGTGF